jgi:uncharacterized OB-fold protein
MPSTGDRSPALLPARPLPVVDDADTAGYWQAARDHRLVVRCCRACGRDLPVPRAVCRYCHSWQTAWRDLQPRGRLVSWTVVQQALLPGFTPPYTLVLVEIDGAPGVRSLGSVPGPGESFYPGMPMAATFEDIDDSVTLLQWRPAPDAGGRR